MNPSLISFAMDKIAGQTALAGNHYRDGDLIKITDLKANLGYFRCCIRLCKCSMTEIILFWRNHILNNLKKRLEPTEIQSYRRILRIAWTEYVSYDKVFEEM